MGASTPEGRRGPAGDSIGGFSSNPIFRRHFIEMLQVIRLIT